jgi:ribosome recycling factor
LCSLAAIEKALIKSDLGLTPSNDGNVIRLTVPQLTADRRKELLKLVSRLTEDGKVALRNVRRDAIKAYDKLEKVIFLPVCTYQCTCFCAGFYVLCAQVL